MHGIRGTENDRNQTVIYEYDNWNFVSCVMVKDILWLNGLDKSARKSIGIIFTHTQNWFGNDPGRSDSIAAVRCSRWNKYVNEWEWADRITIYRIFQYLQLINVDRVGGVLQPIIDIVVNETHDLAIILQILTFLRNFRFIYIFVKKISVCGEEMKFLAQHRFSFKYLLFKIQSSLICAHSTPPNELFWSMPAISITEELEILWSEEILLPGKKKTNRKH